MKIIIKNIKSSLVPIAVIVSFILVQITACSHEQTNNGFTRIKYNNDDLIVDLGVGLWAWPIPVDFDKDGDNDLLVSCPDKPYNGIYFFENEDGNVKSPKFKPGIKISRAYKNIQASYIDGKIRYLIPGKEIVDLASGKSIEIYNKENVHNEGGRIRANQWKYYDFDGNGALDIIISVGDWSDYGWDDGFDENGEWIRGPLHGYVYLLRNRGSSEKPDYNEPEMVLAGNKPIDVYGMPSANLADFDGDGDLDIVCGEFVDKFTYFRNIGSRQNPLYEEGVYLTINNVPIKMDLEMIVPAAIDWDKDGDIDIIVGQEDGRVAFMENTGNIVNGIPQFLEPAFFKQSADEVKFGALVTPFNVDWDNDGDGDLICGNTAGYIGLIENLDGGNPPVWAEPVYLNADNKVIRIQAGKNGSIQGPCESKWGYTAVNVGDWNNDGLNDIIVNSIWGKVLWYQNIGTPNNPELAAAKSVKIKWEGQKIKPDWFWWEPDSNTFVTQWRTTPVVKDLNEDGLLDLIMLDQDGYLAFFERTLEANELILLPGKKIFFNEQGKPLQLNSKTSGRSGRRKIALTDWDLDGKLDLLVNSKNANFYKNISTQTNKYIFKDMGMVDDKILAGHTTSPTMVDWDKNGVNDILLGAEDGFLYLLKNPHD